MHKKINFKNSIVRTKRKSIVLPGISGIFLLLFQPVVIAAITPAVPSSSQTLDVTAGDSINFDVLSGEKIADFIGWVKTPARHDNLCGGYYLEPDIVKSYQNPAPIGDAETTITATKSILFTQHGISILLGDVKLTQPGRQITADKLTFQRDEKSGEVNYGTLIGRVHLREYGKIIVANTGNWDAKTKLITLKNSVYRMLRPAQSGNPSNAWGVAHTIVRDDAGVLNLSKASYTTCAPDNSSWAIWSDKVTLDKNSGRGVATNSLFLVKDVPIFYFPYFNFPIDKRRKSGFLYPIFSYSNSLGFDVALPYYLNLAPNYDAMITPRLLTSRGLLAEGLFRYLTPKSSGVLDLRIIPHDNKFASFKRDSKAKYAQDAQNSNATNYALSRLQKASNDRGFISYQNKTNFNEHWAGNINLSYATDDYFLQDFYDFSSNNQDQLFNQVDVSYAGENWNFVALAQAFQTLHPINQSPASQDQYRRLPELSLKGDFPNQKYGFDYQLVTKFVNFDYDHLYDLASGSGSKRPIVTGSRVNLIPGVALPVRFGGGYVTPKVELFSAAYSLKNNFTADKVAKNSVYSNVPVLSVDSGLYLGRNISFFSNDYTQTLEPRLFYLFVPNTNQTNIPVFDGALSAFNFDQLFAHNRFSGYDLVGDANQVSMAITTRILDGATGEENFSASIGQMYAFRTHAICINGNCDIDPLAHHRISPIVGKIQYNLTHNWSASANAAWDPNVSRFNNGDVGVTYSGGVNQIARVSYNFVQDGDRAIATAQNYSNRNNLSRINLAVAFPIKERWNVVADWNYNISHGHPQEYFYGIEYQNCCWAVRVVQSRNFIGTDPNNGNVFKQALYLQFMLKSLSSVGTSNAGSMLAAQIPGYQDNFKSF